MKLFLTCSVVVALTLGLAPHALAQRSPQRACRFNDLQSSAWTPYEVKVTSRCLAKRMRVDVGTAMMVGWRESNWQRFAWNHSSDCRGVYQHMYSYWWSRVHTYTRKLNKYHVHSRVWYSPRAQAVVTFAMVKKGGWGPWTTAP